MYKYYLFYYSTDLEQFNINNQIAIARFDIIVDSRLNPKILEVNSCEIGMIQTNKSLPKFIKTLMKYIDNFMFKLPNNIT